MTALSSVSNVAYGNWANGEPNDVGRRESYAHLLGYGAQKGQWNDWPNTGNAEGYVVEYGGMAGETMAVLSAAKTVAMSIPAKPIITVGVDDQFNDTAWDSWVPSSSPGSAQTMTGAWLQLTPVTQS